MDYSPCHLHPQPLCCKALLLRCGTLKTHTVHSGPAIADLLCSCAVFHFILQLAGMPLQEDTAKSPRSGHTATLLIITNTRHVSPLLRLPTPTPTRPVLAVILLLFLSDGRLPPATVLRRLPALRLPCFIFSAAFIAYFLHISIKFHLTMNPEINPEEKGEGVCA